MSRSLFQSQKWLGRVGWLILIWGISVTALLAVALALRAVLSIAGMTT
ncbi:hypothetical protein BST63_27510 [Bradyrhizobium canariense]|uniref:DUF2474 domain-containing protein n=1 Tax=Bradyrhizobium canariense TaxID=255045 RepID=A0ABX3WZ04_9BRAD|nr:DUF2474 family protein [Bradyrhizobium canariense]OSJ08964.1 hypothetical protein BSR47_35875 [Bradyrhizobium canariense]OSJ24281.1 hypothetical protein BST63_27510 [Bradyrhizobium canariense]